MLNHIEYQERSTSEDLFKKKKERERERMDYVVI